MQNLSSHTSVHFIIIIIIMIITYCHYMKHNPKSNVFIKKLLDIIHTA